MYDDIALFINIVNHNGLSAAAKYLNMPVATVSRRLKKLENQLGVQLIRRSARQFVLSAEGQAYYQSYAGLYAELENVQNTLSLETHALKGKLKILAPTNISIGLLQPMWLAFIQEYPAIRLELSLNNAFEDIISTQADLAIRIGAQVDSSLKQKRLGAVSTIFVAAPDYLSQHGCPETIDDLTDHNLLGVKAISTWELTHQDTHQRKVIQPYFSTMVNDLCLAHQLVCGGTGIALLPVSEILDTLKSGKIKQLLPNWRGPVRDIFIVWPSGKLLSARAKCFRDFILDYFQNISSDLS